MICHAKKRTAKQALKACSAGEPRILLYFLRRGGRLRDMRRAEERATGERRLQ
jgi:hypothetical protein